MPSESLIERISADALMQLPLVHYTGPIEQIQNDRELSLVSEQLQQHQLLGFDTESLPVFKKGQNSSLALIQIATASTVYLIQLNRISSISPLIPVFSNKNILKAGIALHHDIQQISTLASFTPKGFTEITTITKQLGIINTGLRPLAGILLNYRISKIARSSNWGRTQLTQKQITYAATDAWVSLKLYIAAQEHLEMSAVTT